MTQQPEDFDGLARHIDELRDRVHHQDAAVQQLLEETLEAVKEFKKGELRSGSKKGPVVKNPKQAVAIGLAEQRKAGGATMPMGKAKKK